MDDRALLTFKDTDDTKLISCSGGKAVLDQTFFKARWDLGPKSIYISERTTFDGEVVNFLVSRSADDQWTLESGKRYIVRGIVDTPAVEGTPSALQTSDTTRDSSQLRSTIDEAGSTTALALSWVGIPNDHTIISSFQALRQVRGKSELSRLDLTVFTHQLVVQAIRYVKGRVLFGAELDHDRTPVTTQRCKPANHAGLQPAEDEGDQELIRKFPQKPANPAASQSPDDDAQEMISNFPQMPANPAASRSPCDDQGELISKFPQRPADPAAFRSPDHESQEELTSKFPQRPADPAGSRQDELQLEEDMILNSHRRQATAGANTRGVPTANVTSQTIPATPACIDNDDNTAHVGNTFVAEAQQHRDSHVHSTPLRNTRSTTSAHASRPATVADRVTPRTTRRTTAPANRHHASGSRHHEPAVVLISSDSDIEVLDFAQRIRPPTRSVPFIPHQPLHQGTTQYGLLILEVHADVRQWHICRTSNRGAGPACFAATPRRAAPRAMCKTKLRVSGFQRLGVGFVAPTFIGKTSYMNVKRYYRFWFCPNGRCHRGPDAPQCRTQMPHVPTVIPVFIGTSLTQDEVDFLTEAGFLLVHRARSEHEIHAFPEEAEIKILLQAYPERVQDFPRNHRFRSRGGRPCRQKVTLSQTCQTKLERARSSQIRVLFSWTITTGNGYGKLFKILSGTDPGRIYIVQICCFPACSCQDFWEREVRRSTFTPCKHIYWVYLEVLRIDPLSQRIHQPVHTLEEVDSMLRILG
ncbi:hypothetical protein R1sor_020271 [Riccia sorocarpa]|uniref:SWIM-type domain-containing protein n=1 Tax=Riccia sorocarpa TaxID=122646 RepID=A0ABD3IGJ1_9MARC